MDLVFVQIIIDQQPEGIILIKPDWDEYSDTGFGSTSHSGTNEGFFLIFYDYSLYIMVDIERPLVELKEDISTKEAIDTYEYVLRRSEKKNKALGMYHEVVF